MARTLMRDQPCFLTEDKGFVSHLAEAMRDANTVMCVEPLRSCASWLGVFGTWLVAEAVPISSYFILVILFIIVSPGTAK